jgi:CRP-like cAMP-binding protein
MGEFSEKKQLIEPCNKNCSFCFLNYADILSNNFLFRNLSHHEIGKVIRNIHHQTRSYKNGDLVASSGDRYNNLLIIVQGAVVGELIDFEGRVLRIEELKAPDTVASAFIFGSKNELPVNITATQETKLLVIPRTELLILFRQHEIVLHNFLDIMANRAQYLSQKIRILGLQTLRGKLAHYLLQQVKITNSTIFILPNTQNEIANLLGVTRPSVGRAFREMHNEGFIEARGKKIQILDKRRLSELLR